MAGADAREPLPGDADWVPVPKPPLGRIIVFCANCLEPITAGYSLTIQHNETGTVMCRSGICLSCLTALKAPYLPMPSILPYADAYPAHYTITVEIVSPA